MRYSPREPSGTNREAIWMRWVHNEILRLRNIRIGSGGTSSETRGFTLFPVSTVEEEQTASTISQYRVKSVSENHLVCRTWDGATEGGDDVLIAKPSEFRRSTWDGETIEVAGKEHEYTYTGEQSRTDRTASKEWPQIILPAYDTDCIIYAAEEVEGGTGVTVGEGESAEEITLVDLNVDGRSWATRIPYCDAGTAKYFYAVGSAPQLP